ncbi:MAG: DNA-binding protein [Desulfurococcaceae archaeon]
MSQGGISEKTIVVSARPLRDYLINIALLFQEGANIITIKGYGKFISKAVDLYNAIILRMKDSIELVGISIGTESIQGKSKPYIAIKVQRRY